LAVAVALLGCFGGVAAADTSETVVTTTVFPGGNSQITYPSVTLDQLLNNCPEYDGDHAPSQSSPPNTSATITQEAWTLATVVTCGLSTPTSDVNEVQVEGGATVGWETPLTSDQLGEGAYADPTAAPVVFVNGSGGQVSYFRPQLNAGDNNSVDAVGPGGPIAIEVYENGAHLTVNASKSISGSTVSFGASVVDANGKPVTDSALTWQWQFGDSGGSEAPSPTHTYTGTGTYTVVVQVNDQAAGEGGVDTIDVNISGQQTTTTTRQTTTTTQQTTTTTQQTTTPIQQTTSTTQQTANGPGGTGPGSQDTTTQPQNTTTTTPGDTVDTSTTSTETTTSTDAISTGPTGGATSKLVRKSTTQTTNTNSPGTGTHKAKPNTNTRTSGTGSGSSSTTHQSTGTTTTTSSQGAAPGGSPTSHLKSPPATTPPREPIVVGQLISDVTPLPPGESPLVHQAAATAPSEQAQAVRQATTTSVLAGIGAALLAIAIFGLGAGRELLWRRSWWPSRLSRKS
jgi:hypothetical protein